jgi:hypothetical protein
MSFSHSAYSTMNTNAAREILMPKRMPKSKGATSSHTANVALRQVSLTRDSPLWCCTACSSSTARTQGHGGRVYIRRPCCLVPASRLSTCLAALKTLKCPAHVHRRSRATPSTQRTWTWPKMMSGRTWHSERRVRSNGNVRGKAAPK